MCCRFLYGVYYPGFMLLGPLPVIIVIGVLLLSLLVLHYFWFVLLVKAVYGCLVLGKVNLTVFSEFIMYFEEPILFGYIVVV